MRGAADVDHFLPWARWPDNGIENLVAGHPGCNNQKRGFLAAAVHLEKWARRFDPAGNEGRDMRFDPAGNEGQDLRSIAGDASWDSHPDRTHGVARSLYLRRPDEADLWLAGNDFVAPEWPAIRAALRAGAAPPAGRV